LHKRKEPPKGFPSNLWFGEIPEHWGIVPGREIFREIISRNYHNEPLLSVTIKEGVIRQSDLAKSTPKKDVSNEDKYAYKLVQPGDLVYNKMRAWQGAVGVSTYRGLVSPAYVVQRLRCPEDLPRYFHYLLRTPLFKREAERWSYGITSDQWSLRSEDFKRILFPRPPSGEQRAIVKFLNWAERRIRFIVAARKRRIQLLEEYRQALINDAVTGKFDVRTGKPYPSYKDSGVPWLGKVPEHWHLVTLKRLAKSYRNGTTPPTAQSEYYASGEVPWYGPSSCESNEIVSAPIRYISNIALEDGVVKLVRGPALLIVVIGATAGKMALMPHDGTTNQQITAFELPYNLRASLFIVRQLRSSEEWLRGTASTATIPILKTSVVTHLHCAIPPEEEMHAIADYLDREAEKIDAAIEKTKESIALWEELRETLISDVVTGKLDVREAAERLPEEEPELEERVKALEGLLLGGESEVSRADSEPELASAEETA